MEHGCLHVWNDEGECRCGLTYDKMMGMAVERRPRQRPAAIKNFPTKEDIAMLTPPENRVIYVPDPEDEFAPKDTAYILNTPSEEEKVPYIYRGQIPLEDNAPPLLAEFHKALRRGGWLGPKEVKALQADADHYRQRLEQMSGMISAYNRMEIDIGKIRIAIGDLKMNEILDKD